MADFLLALQEIKPAFGINSMELTSYIRGGIHNFGERFTNMHTTVFDFIKEVQESDNTPLLTVLLEGKYGCGKTALAANFAIKSGFPFVKMISPETFVGYSEQSKISAMVKIFDDAYKSPLSLIVLDDIERLIEFIHIGPRFSNPVLQALLVLIKKRPPNPDRKLMIIGTTSMKSILQEMEVVDCFNVCLNMPSLKLQQEITTVLNNFKGSSEEMHKISQDLAKNQQAQGGITIKNLMLCIELALQKSREKKIEYENFMTSLYAVNQHS